MRDSRHELQTPNRFRLSSGELLAVVAFWAFLAAFSAAGRLLDPRTPDLDPAFTKAFVATAFIEYSLWALLTVPILMAVSRIERSSHSLAARTMWLLALGATIAILMDTVLRGFRYELLPPSPRRSSINVLGNIARFEFLDDLMVYLAVAAAAMAREYFLHYQARLDETRRLQSQLAEAQLATLRTQLNPHFLFNTLNAVATLVDSDPRGVRKMIARLSDLLRHTLDETSEAEIPLAREAELLRRYLEIMEIRFQGALDVTVSIDPSLGNALVPNLILQPLVENAFKHGLVGMQAGARIEVGARRDGDDLVLSVRDNGAGLATGPRIDGVGLTNTVARLRQLYGDGDRFTLEAAAAGSGAVSEVRLPYHVTPLARAMIDG